MSQDPQPAPPPESVALLVPCRDGSAMLPRLAASARAQTRPFDEWLLFDDGSTDDTAAVARQLGFSVAKGDRPLGPAAARNALAASTRCTWLHFHDADDLLAEDYVAASLAAARNGADLVICDMPWVDEQTGRRISHWHYDEQALRAKPFATLIRQTIGGINALYRRDKFLSVGGFDEQRHYWEDLDLSLRLFRAGVRFAVINRDLVTALRRAQSYSNQNSVRVWSAKLDLLAEWLEADRASVAATVAEEAEAIAVRMLGLREMEAAARAVQLCLRAGGSPPTTESAVIKLAKTFLPPFAALRLQQWARRAASHPLSS